MALFSHGEVSSALDGTSLGGSWEDVDISGGGRGGACPLPMARMHPTVIFCLRVIWRFHLCVCQFFLPLLMGDGTGVPGTGGPWLGPDVQREYRHGDQYAVSRNIQTGLRECNTVDTRAAIVLQWVAGPREDGRERDRVCYNDTGEDVQGYAVSHPNVNAVVESDE